MTDAGRGIVDIDLDDANVQRKLRGIDKTAGSVGRSSGSSFGSSFASSVGRGLSGLGHIVSGAAKAATVGLGGLATVAGGFGLKIAAQNEQAAVSFNLLLGSGQKAQAFLGQLQQFAAKTPFEFPELRDAASRLLAVGTNAKDVIPIMETLGDSTAALGTGSEGIQRAVTALTQVQQKGKVAAEEMLQLTEAGIPAWDALAAELGTNVAGAQDAVTKRQVTANQLFEALETKAGPALQRVTGLMDVQSQTLSGLLSTLKDTVSQNLGTQLAPLAQTIKGLLPNITKMAGDLASVFGFNAAKLAGPLIKVVSTLGEIAAPVIASLADGFADLFGGLAGGLKAAGPGIAKFADAFGHLGAALAPAAELLGSAIGEALKQLAPVLDTLISAFKPLVPILGKTLLGALKALAPIWPVFTDALKQLSPLIAKVGGDLGAELVSALKDLVPVLLKNAPAGIKLAEAMLNLLDALAPIIGPLSQLLGLFSRLEGLEIGALAVVIQALATAIGAVVRFDFAAAWGKVTSAITGFASAVGSAIPAVVGFFQRLPGQIIGALSTLVTQLIPKGAEMLGGFLAGLVQKLPELIGFMIALPIVLNQKLGALAARLIPKALSFLAGFLTGLVQKLPELAAWMAALPGKLEAKLAGLAAKLIPKGIEFLGGVLTGMIRKLPSLVSFITSLPAKLISAFGSVAGTFSDIGTRIVQGIWNGISRMTGWIVGKVKSFAGDLLSGALKAFKIGSPSKLFADRVGKPIAQGIGVGIEQNMPTIPLPDVPNLHRSIGAAMPDAASLAAGAGTNQPLFQHIGDNVFESNVDLDRWEFQMDTRLAFAS